MRPEVQNPSGWFVTLVTLGALKTRGAVTRSGHWVAELVRLGTLAHLVAVVAEGAWKTSWWEEEEEEERKDEEGRHSGNMRRQMRWNQRKAQIRGRQGGGGG